MPNAATVSEYLAKTPPNARNALKRLRAAIKAAAPGITERISYRIPTFELDGRYILYITAFKEHVSVYPVTAAMVAKHGKAIAPYRAGKGTLRFSLDAPIPWGSSPRWPRSGFRSVAERNARSGPKRPLAGRASLPGGRWGWW